MTSLPPDPYKILGVSKDAQLPEIRSAHRKLVLKCHPDKVMDPALKAIKQDEFQRVQQAYELLSDEKERSKYDDQVKLMELRKNFEKMSANTSAPRTPPRHYDVRTAEPRSSTFASSPVPPPQPKMYSQRYHTRTSDEDIRPSHPIFEEPPRPRRTDDYEKHQPRRDDRRDSDRARRRKEEEEEDRRERERQLEKEARRQEKKRFEKLEKEREKERRRETEDKRSRHRTPYVEEPPEEEVPYLPRVEKKKSSSSTKKTDERREKSSNRDDVHVDPTRKTHEHMISAANYLMQSRAKASQSSPTLNRSQTYGEPGYHVRYVSPSRGKPGPAVPTPPPAGSSPFATPIIEEEDDARRSSARGSGRRASHDSPQAAKSKSLHKGSSSGPDELPTSPIIMDASPSARRVPAFATTPPVVPNSPPRTGISRSSTMDQPQYARPMPPMPGGMKRSETFHGVEDRGRSRSRNYAQVQIEEDDYSEEDRRYKEPARKQRDGRRHKTRSPDRVPVEYVQRPTTKRYNVSHDGRTIPVEAYFDDDARRKHGKSGAYYPRVVEARPPMPSRDHSWSNSSGSFRFKTAPAYGQDDISYSNVPRCAREEAWAA
jgi:curved DNA-binding protein CbpA